MAEDEQGFTFVDKRRTQAEAPPEEDPVAPGTALEDDPIPDALPEDQASDFEEAPDVYAVLGYCLSLLSSHAWQNLGLIAGPGGGEMETDLAQAKVAIDAVGDLAARLEAAPDDAVPAAMKRNLRNLLNDLRLNFVSRRDAASGIQRP